MSKIEDFGEKIGGARKDLYALNRALRLSDVADWSDTDRESYITKKETFPLPDYKKLYESGVDRRVVWFIKKLRDALPTKPQKPYARDMNDEEKRQALRKAQEDYITTMSGIYDEAMKLAVPYGTVYECISFYDRIKNLPDKSCLTGSRKIREISTLTSTYVRSHFFDEMDKKQFLYTDEEKILANYRIYRYDGTNVLKPGELSPGSERDDCLMISPSAGIRYYSYGNDPETADMSTWQTDTWFAMDRRSSGAVAAHSIQTEDELKDLLVAMEKERGTPTQDKQTKKRKVKYTPPQLAAIRPVSRDYRGGHDITGEDMMNTFGFRAGEFGNWESDNDRLANLNMSYDAFKDLARVLDIDDRDISLGGNLAIAYGARGRKGAAAHFEPGSNVINLTKMNGAGSLAHEWGHALDYAAARSGNLQEIFLTESDSPAADRSEKFCALMTAIKYKPFKDREGKDREGHTGDFSDFYLNAQRLDATYTKQGHGYWTSSVELFARAFAAYVKFKTAPEPSDYLCAHAEAEVPAVDKDGNMSMVPVYPTGEERLRINAAFDDVIVWLKERGVLHARPQEQKEHDINSRPRRRQAESPDAAQEKEKEKKTMEAVQEEKEMETEKNTEKQADKTAAEKKLAYIWTSTADAAKENGQIKAIADALLERAEKIMQGIREAGLLTQSKTQTGTVYTDKAVVEAGPAVSWNRETACEEPMLHRDGTQVYSGTIKLRHGDTTITLAAKEDVSDGARISAVTASMWDRSGDIPRLSFYKQADIAASPIPDKMKAVVDHIIKSGVIEQRAPQSALAAFAVEANKYFTESSAKVENAEGKTVNNAYAKYDKTDYGERVLIYNHDDNVVVELGVTAKGDRYVSAVNYDENERGEKRAEGEKPRRTYINNIKDAVKLCGQPEVAKAAASYKKTGTLDFDRLQEAPKQKEPKQETPEKEEPKQKVSKETADRMTPPESEQTAKSPKKTETKKTGKSR